MIEHVPLEVEEALSYLQEHLNCMTDRLDVMSERIDFAMQAIYDLQRKKADKRDVE